MKPFLILQLRPETIAADDEYESILAKSGLQTSHSHRIRLDREPDIRHLSLDDYSGVIVGGGPGCVSDAPAEKSAQDSRMELAVLRLMSQVTATDKPFLGCCYGIGILAHHLGAEVSKRRYSEPVGAVDCFLTTAGCQDPLLANLDRHFRAFVGHKEAVQALPVDCVHLVESETCPFQMIRYGNNVYATQFHPEADGNSFEVRINVYRDAGYFPANDAQALIDAVQAELVYVPERILRNFVERYG